MAVDIYEAWKGREVVPFSERSSIERLEPAAPGPEPRKRSYVPGRHDDVLSRGQ